MIAAARYAPGPLCDKCLPKPCDVCTVAHGLRKCLICGEATDNGCPVAEVLERAQRAQMDTLDDIGGVTKTDPSPPPSEPPGDDE